MNFVAGDGGTAERDRIFVTDITEHASEAKIRRKDDERLEHRLGTPKRLQRIIVPGMSDIHAMFAKDVQSFEGVFNSPLIGWISGVHLSEIGKRAAEMLRRHQYALGQKKPCRSHVRLPPGEAARVDIINLFKQGNGDVITFDTEGFASEGKCSIGGVPTSLASYIADRKIDTKLPLVADYNGAMINVSIQSVDTAGGKVQFYAPVFKDIKYRFAKPVPDYAGGFAEGVHDKHANKVAFSCNAC